MNVVGAFLSLFRSATRLKITVVCYCSHHMQMRSRDHVHGERCPTDSLVMRHVKSKKYSKLSKRGIDVRLW